MIKAITTSVIIFLLLVNISVFSQTDPAALKADAQKQMSLGRYGEAIELLNRYISAKPQDPQGYNLRGLANEKRGQYEQAVYDLRSARKLASSNPEIINNLKRVTDSWYALLYNKIEGHKREIAINPNKAENYLQIGKCYKNLGEWLIAEEWYDKYLQRAEPSADEVIRYTEILAKNGHITKGEPLLKRFTEKYPNDHRIWSRYGYFTMWLGKTQIAINAFETALQLRPYFKEAMDGLDQAKGKGYIYTINDTSGIRGGKPATKQYAGYPIDNLYKRLRSHPDDIDSRYKLVDELVQNNRYEEAYTQLLILQGTQSEKDRFKSLWTTVTDARKSFYANQIAQYQAKLESDPYDKEAVLKLGEYYGYMKDYDKAMMLFENYLQMRPEDQQVRFRYAQYAAWNKEYATAKELSDDLLVIDPNNTQYQLLNSQISVWTNTDLDKAEELLTDVLRKEPENLQALTAMSLLNFQQEDYAASQKYLDNALSVDPANADLKQIQYNLELQKEIAKEAEYYAILEEARKAVYDEDCERALELYNEYSSKTTPSDKIKEEIAQAYVCSGDYNSAIDIYSELIENNESYALKLQRAKVYYWAGDSLNALKEFQQLVNENPDDAEAMLYLGDSYVKMEEYDKARDVYDQLLEDSPSSQLIQTRMGWLGGGGTAAGYGYAPEFPTYILINPEASFFADNLDFKYDLQGIRLELGVTDFLSISGSAFRGGLENDADRLNLSMVKGQAFLRFGKYVSVMAGVGQTFFSNQETSPITEGSIKAEDEGRYSISASYTSMDAAQIIYSPYLVTERLQVGDFSIRGYYFVERSIYLSGRYTFLNVSDDNAGNVMEFRIGKGFDEFLLAGYEYYYLSFNNQSSLYWSPETYQSHSVWAEWDVVEDRTSKVTIGGKLGIIPENNFILREIFGTARIMLAERFTLQGRLSFGSTVQQRLGYNSTSLGISAFWTL